MHPLWVTCRPIHRQRKLACDWMLRCQSARLPRSPHRGDESLDGAKVAAGTAEGDVAVGADEVLSCVGGLVQAETGKRSATINQDTRPRLAAEAPDLDEWCVPVLEGVDGGISPILEPAAQQERKGRRRQRLLKVRGLRLARDLGVWQAIAGTGSGPQSWTAFDDTEAPSVRDGELGDEPEDRTA